MIDGRYVAKIISEFVLSLANEANLFWPCLFCLQYSQLPGIIGERFFAVLDLNSSGYVDLKEFVHGLFKIYYSDTDTKLKFAFDM